MTTSQGLDEIVLRSSPAVGSLCLALLLTAPPLTVRSPQGIATGSIAEQPRSAIVYTSRSSTEVINTADNAPGLAEQLARLFLTLGGTRDVGLLSKICNVSKNTYYGWLKGETVSADNRERLVKTIELLGQIASRRHNVVEFLNESSDIGSPADQLRAGRFDVVLGMSYFRSPTFAGHISPKGRRLKSAPFAARAATPGQLRDARRVKDVLREPNPEAYVDIDEGPETVALGSAIIVG